MRRSDRNYEADMTTLPRFLVLNIALMLAVATVAQAQVEGPGPTATVSASLGGASTSADTGLAIGGAIVVDIHRWFSVEGEGIYADRGPGANALTLTGSVLANLLPLGRRVVPYAAVGGGLYRASFDLAHQRFMGGITGGFGPGTQICAAPGTSGPGPGAGGGFGPGTGTCPNDLNWSWGVGELPNFYGRRLGVLSVPAGLAWETRTFTDPSLSLGGGVRFDVTNHFIIRPDVRALLVFAEGDTHMVGRFGVNVGYKF